ncbi:DUF5704 domain-containing protein [Lachnoclostridium phytofermentans]|uniref:DUF5704 domain-containing protein n=1 Tax=Lachnoclostridium phytofermentans (strain ATCC 700394 / DSM 18823 / ISDg) TaxID=357809 RepID=A9KKR1_LACP7|nr:DUF5704 domain-containing protein [Lachnoclostridium phytofermentans]ABX41232.1 hypothetical protein Cphy_0845 [Lachnoclostridium phytofermentans ISDg]
MKRRDRCVPIFLIVFIVMSLFSPITVYAGSILHKSYAEYRDDYMIQEILNDGIDPSGNKSIYIINMNRARSEGLMTMYGEHKKSQSSIHYATEGYNFTIKETDGDVTQYSTANEERIFVKPLTIDDITIGDLVKSTYELPFGDISRAAIRMHVKEEMRNGKNLEQAEKIVNAKLNSDGLIVYYCHEFAVYDNKTMIKGPYPNLEDIKNAIDWSYETKETYLPAYYDIPLKITSKMIPSGSYSIQLVDMTDNQTKNFTLNDVQSGKYSIDYKLPNSTQNQPVRNEETLIYDTPSLIADSSGQQYKFLGKAFYSYEDTPGKSVTAKVTENEISQKNVGTGKAVLILGYVKAGEESTVKVNYYHESDNGIKTLMGTKSAGTIKPNTSFSFSEYVKPSYTYQGENYTYKDKWSYSYYGDDGTMTTLNGKSGDTKIIIPNFMKGSEVVVSLYYKGKEPIPEPPKSTTIDYFDASPTNGQIRSDYYGAEKFSVEQGIPTTENLYASVRAPEYLIKASFQRNSTSKQFQVEARKKYILKWYTEEEKPIKGDPDGKTEIVKTNHTETKDVKQTVTITRQVKYTELLSFDYFKINQANLVNAALPRGDITLLPFSYSVPSISYQSFGDIDQHIIVPPKVKSGVDLPAETIDLGGIKPSIPMNDFTTEVDALIPEVQVKNDVFQFDNRSVMNDQYKLKETEEAVYSAIRRPELTLYNTLYQSNLTIPATLANSIYPSNGSIRYEKVASFQSTKPSEETYPISNINSITVHTPVYCQGTLIQDNASYVQLSSPNKNCIPLVLDEEGDSSDFTVSISNYGSHNSYPGYYIRDYVSNTLGNAYYIARNKDGILRNEVCFPFDVLIDVGNDRDMSNDILLNKNTWYAVGLYSTQRFYLPMYVECGIYTVEFRTIAVNGEGMLSSVQLNANLTRSNYVATDTKQVEVSGKIYGLTLYDIQENNLWKEIFRSENSLRLKILDNFMTKVIDGVKKAMQRIDGTKLGEVYHKDKLYYYTIGTRNQFGIPTGRDNRFTLPLVDGSHPKYLNKGTLKAGYTWRFTLDTVGNITATDESKIIITPTFYYVDKKGLNREEVDMYYTDTISGNKNHYIKVGSKIDLENTRQAQTGDVYLGIPDEELKDTASIRNISYKTWTAQKKEMYSYGRIVSDLAFKTFSNQNYASRIHQGTLSNSLLGLGYSKQKLTKYKQSYYFNYSLPSDIKAVKKGTDVQAYAKKYGISKVDNLWLSKGFIIIHFDIKVYDEKNNLYLTYDNVENEKNLGHCNMFQMEGINNTKKDYFGRQFTFKSGDIILIDTDKTSLDDAIVGGLY